VQALEEVIDNGEITLLRIDDYNTSGLTGAERGGDRNADSRFASLCRDTLYSAKSSNTAGGSHGLGKAVLWRFSGLSTVLFNSTLEDTGDAPNPRFIGRTSLPWHEVDAKAFRGPGWLGREQEEEDGQRYATSLRGADATCTAEALRAGREGDRSGTSIVIVGFREPAEEDRASLREIAEDISAAASKWFWPSLIAEEPSLEVDVTIQENDDVTFDRRVDAEEHDAVRPFIEAHRAWRQENVIDEPAHPGDVAAVPVPVGLPAERERRGHSDPRDAERAEAALVARLASGEEADKSDLTNHVAYFRGARMVVRYRRLERLAVSAQDYHAALVCGTAKERYESDKALERFLRAAEPPEHDTWDSTANLKKAYQRGYKTALNEMNAAVRSRLKRLVTEKTTTGKQGPDLFRRKFPIGNTGGGGGSERSFVDLQRLTAYVEKDGKMHFEGRLRARSRSPEVWEAKLDVRIAEEDKRGDAASVRNFTTPQNGEVQVLHQGGQGELTLNVNEGTRDVQFQGEIDLKDAVADPDLASIDVKAVGQEIDR
jgi:hypothetical protein